MPVKLQNDAFSTLRVGVSNSDTTIVVASGEGARFPTLAGGEYFYATIEDASGNKEIVQVTARSTDSLTVTRGAESTTPRAFVAGSTIELRVTAAGVLDAASDAATLANLGITATAAELNTLDGVNATLTASELNLLDGVTWTLSSYNTLTATAADLNSISGVTWTLSDYNTLTATAAELNKLDGVTWVLTDYNTLTATAAELNKLDGVTWVLTDYNTLTTTAADLNYVAGVTSSIQTQLNNRVTSNADDALTGGYTTTADNDGTQSSGTYTPTPAGGNIKRIVNGGAFTLAAPSAAGDYTLIIQMTNNASAGTVTLSGFTKSSGAAFTTTDGHDFMLYIAKVNGFTHLNVEALQ